MNLPLAILAGGLATRLRPLTDNVPKSMLEINGKPFIYWQLKVLAKSGVTKVVLCTSHKSDLIENYVKTGEEFGVDVTYSHDGEVQLGTGGAVKKALPKLGNKFMVLYGDSFLPMDYFAAEKAYLQGGFENMMTIYNNKLELDQSNIHFLKGKIVEYEKNTKKKNFKYIDYGLNFFSQSAFSGFERNTFFDISEVIRKLVEKQNLGGYEVYNRFYEVGSLRGINHLIEFLRKNQNEFH
jgi:NDP-sugar pyrophosphorylase family protein